MNIEYYTNIFQNLLQQKVAFKCERKILKQGKLQLFTIKQYFIRFHIETEKKDIKILELPYPFKVNYDKNICSLNYHVSSFTNNIQLNTSKLNLLKSNISHKIYDKIVNIIPIK